VPAPEQGFFDAVWGLLSSAMSALTAWAGAHWGDIGLGVLAILATYMATQISKMVLDWMRDERRKKPREMEEDTHRLLVRLAALVNGALMALSFGFREHFGAATGLDFGYFEAAVVGGLMNSGACVGVFHAWKWSHSDAESAKRFRAILRIKSARALKVSEEEIDAAATAKQSPAQMAELRDALKDHDDGDE
jgi:hypothetical protein